MVTWARAGGGGRGLLALAAVLALVLKLAVPAGYMPGISLAAPLVLCPEQDGPPAAASHHRHHAPAKSTDDKAGHACAFAGVGLAAMTTPPADALLAHTPSPAVDAPAGQARRTRPGRGLAAPPPPSHAPPATSA